MDMCLAKSGDVRNDGIYTRKYQRDVYSRKVLLAT